MSEPIGYANTMLLVTTTTGVAAIVFDGPFENGQKYHYRALAKGADKEVTGTGEVFEKYERHLDPKKNVTMLTDIGSQLFIKAGPVEFEWSYADTGTGWIYYDLHQMQVQTGKADEYAALELKTLLNQSCSQFPCKP